MHLRQKNSRKYYWSAAALLAALVIFGWLSEWDIAKNEPAAYTGTFPVLIGSSSKVTVDGTTRNGRKSQTFLLLPGSIDIPYTVTIQNENGTITIDEDRYALLKFIAFSIVFFALPLVHKRWKARQAGLTESA